MADVVVVGVLEAKVVLLDDVHLVVHLLHQLLPRRFLLQRKQMSIQVTNKTKVICANSKLEKNWGLGEGA